MATILARRLTKFSNNRICHSTVPIALGTALVVACISESTSLTGESNNNDEHDSDKNTTCLQEQRRQHNYYPHARVNHSNYSSFDRYLKIENPCLCERGIASKDKPASIDPQKKLEQVRRRQTIVRMDKESTDDMLESRYNIHWNEQPLGVGAFGKVYFATKRKTKSSKRMNDLEKVAIKKIDKKCTDQESFQREMRALLDIREFGGHPNICGLQEHFNLGEHYYLVLDLIGGGELFDNLMCNGGYSEADAARLVREVASALAFLHGIGVVHADLKPENLMLSTPNRGDAVIKLVDFGSAEVLRNDDILNGDSDIDKGTETGFLTPAYCPPESLENIASGIAPAPKPSHDMWALGVILYIILTGVHPYDLNGDASDERVEAHIMSPDRYVVPLSKNSPYTHHLSSSAIDLISKLMNRDPTARITAHEMLNHPWVRGETATTEVMTGSDERLNKLKSKMQRKFFEDVVNWSDDDDETRHKSDLIERSFQSFDAKNKGFLTDDDLGKTGNTEDGGPTLTMSDFSNVLSANMNSQYFPKGHIVYKEGDIGNHMYFINSGRVEVTTKDGSTSSRSQGDFFGEGALLDKGKKRSATIKCKSPVHAMQINREYLEKVFADSDGSEIILTMREKDKIRKRNRAKVILRLQTNLRETRYKNGESVFEHGDSGDSIFIVDEGIVSVNVDDKHVFSVTRGNVFGENSLLTGRQRNSSALCKSEKGCIVQELAGKSFREVVSASPSVKDSLSELCRRRDFKKSVVLRSNKDFPYENPREAFDAVDSSKKGYLDVESVAKLLREMDSSYTDKEIDNVIEALNLTKSGKIEFDEFKKVFIANIRTSASI